jgi:hypothetical protein
LACGLFSYEKWWVCGRGSRILLVEEKDGDFIGENRGIEGLLP